MDVPETFNSSLVETVQPTRPENLLPNLLYLLISSDPDPLFQSSIDLAIETLVPTVASESVFTNDHSQGEILADSIVIQFILGAEADQSC